MSKSKDSGSSAVWDRVATNIFCDLCVKEVELGNRPTTFFNKEGWDNIESRFKELTGRDYGKVKFKNKWDQLKKDWKLWKELKRGSTGLGWDPVKRTIDASEEWWAEKLAVIPTAKKFKFAGIDPSLEEKLDGMFTGVVATGNNYFTPTEDDVPTQTVDIETDHVGDSGDGPSQIHTDIQSTGGTKRPRIEKNKKGLGFVKGSIETLIEISKHNAKPKKDSTINDSVKILNTYLGIKDDMKLYVRYVRLLGNSTQRQFFETLDPECRLPYLQSFMKD